MKKKNNNIKLIIIVSAINLFIGVLLSSSISYAAVKYTSKDVTFTPSNSNWKVNNVDSALTSLYGLAGSFGVVPVGTINSMMGNTAPKNYLICDGTTYNIKDYPELAEYFKNELGSSNYFGGDGTTTFAVPDLRGEFLRGSGTNSHTNQGNGANVGVHQDGTLFPRISTNGTGAFIYRDNATYGEWQDIQGQLRSNEDFRVKATAANVRFGQIGTVNTNSTEQDVTYTSRPTNTSVLYVIASKDIYVESKDNYSTEEQVVGTWTDGKPIYQKTINVADIGTGNQGTVATGINDAETVIATQGHLKIIEPTRTFFIPIGWINLNNSTKSLYFSGFLDIVSGNFNWRKTNDSYNNTSMSITLQYTKTTD